MDGNADPTNNISSVTPPYAAYVAFDTFTRRTELEKIPQVVDKSLLVSWEIAAGNESGLLTSLKALGLIDGTGRPTELYREIRLSATRRIPALRRCIEFAYVGLPSAGRPIDADRLHDYFVEERGLIGQMVSKAMRFYRQIVAATLEDGLPAEATPSALAPQRRPVSPPVPPRSVPRRPTASTPESTPRVLRHRPGGRGGSEPAVTIMVTVAPDHTEEDLTGLFRRVRRAWSKSRQLE